VKELFFKLKLRDMTINAAMKIIRNHFENNIELFAAHHEVTEDGVLTADQIKFLSTDEKILVAEFLEEQNKEKYEFLNQF